MGWGRWMNLRGYKVSAAGKEPLSPLGGSVLVLQEPNRPHWFQLELSQDWGFCRAVRGRRAANGISDELCVAGEQQTAVMVPTRDGGNWLFSWCCAQQSGGCAAAAGDGDLGCASAGAAEGL